MKYSIFILMVILMTSQALALNYCGSEVSISTECIESVPNLGACISNVSIYNASYNYVETKNITQLAGTGVYYFSFTGNTLGIHRWIVCDNLTSGTINVRRSIQDRITDIDNNLTLILADTNELQTNQNWDVWDDATRVLTALDEDSTTIDLDSTTVGGLTNSVVVSSLNNDVITANSIASDAIGSSELATAAVNEVVYAVNNNLTSEHGSNNWNGTMLSLAGIATQIDVTSARDNIKLNVSAEHSFTRSEINNNEIKLDYITSNVTRLHNSSEIYNYFVSGTNEDQFKADVSSLATTSQLNTAESNIKVNTSLESEKTRLNVSNEHVNTRNLIMTNVTGESDNIILVVLSESNAIKLNSSAESLLTRTNISQESLLIKENLSVEHINTRNTIMSNTSAESELIRTNLTTEHTNTRNIIMTNVTGESDSIISLISSESDAIKLNSSAESLLTRTNVSLESGLTRTNLTTEHVNTRNTIMSNISGESDNIKLNVSLESGSIRSYLNLTIYDYMSNTIYDYLVNTVYAWLNNESNTIQDSEITEIANTTFRQIMQNRTEVYKYNSSNFPSYDSVTYNDGTFTNKSYYYNNQSIISNVSVMVR